LEHFLSFLNFIGQTVYTTLPAILANMAPLFVQKVNILNYPIDFNTMYKGKPVLGPNKTIRGFISGIILAEIVFYLQYLLYKTTGFNYTLYQFEDVFMPLLGFLMGFGVMFGDTFKSLIKRRLDYPASKSFVPWDQIDCVIGGLVFVRIGWAFSLKYAATILILTFFIHISGRHAGYYMGLCKSKW
jgi:CDP-2,3-bis-(O-geranylgeranyl)-sn-glycerol synthase